MAATMLPSGPAATAEVFRKASPGSTFTTARLSSLPSGARIRYSVRVSRV